VRRKSQIERPGGGCSPRPFGGAAALGVSGAPQLGVSRCSSCLRDREMDHGVGAASRRHSPDRTHNGQAHETKSPRHFIAEHVRWQKTRHYTA